ncbi:hypothetical protein EMIT0P218_130055 [Pseudomonas sp. IT-P218]
MTPQSTESSVAHDTARSASGNTKVMLYSNSPKRRESHFRSHHNKNHINQRRLNCRAQINYVLLTLPKVFSQPGLLVPG